MVGILIRVGENKLDPEKIAEIIESKDRTKSGKTAPAEGLYLTNIEYWQNANNKYNKMQNGGIIW